MRSLTKSLVSTLAIVVITAFLLEIAVRLVDGRPVFTIRNWVAQTLEANTENHSSRYDPGLGWSAKPNLDIQGIFLDDPNIPDMSDVVVTTDARGFRSTGPMPDGGADLSPIVTIGDSFTWGSEVGDLDTYPAHLQAITGRPIVNAAYGGWGTDQMWLRMNEVADSMTPGLIVLSPLTNDVLRNAYRRYGRAFKPYFVLEGDTLAVRNLPSPRNSTRPEDVGYWQSWFGWSYLVFFGARALGLEEVWINRNLLTDRVHDNEVAVDIACRLLGETASFSKARDIPVVLALIYSGGEVATGERHWFTQQYLDCAKEVGLPVIDTFEAFLEASQTEDDFPASRYRVWKNGNVAHMNSAGNRLVAETIASQLRESGLIEAF
ncbi:MAG: SGNH/GDSL hydrolase family protein [Pseudomonadota bacterium]